MPPGSDPIALLADASALCVDLGVLVPGVAVQAGLRGPPLVVPSSQPGAVVHGVVLGGLGLDGCLFGEQSRPLVGVVVEEPPDDPVTPGLLLAVLGEAR